MYPGIQEPAVENMPSPAHIRFDCDHICHFLSYIRKSYHERTDKFVGIYYGGKILALDGKKVYNKLYLRFPRHCARRRVQSATDEVGS